MQCSTQYISVQFCMIGTNGNFIRAVMVWATSMSGHRVMEVKTMIATVMAMQPPCGPFPSTRPSTREKMHTMMKAVHPRLHPHFLMGPKIPTLEW